MNKDRFYVYLHTYKETGEVFYVGKGTMQRSRSKGSRSLAWMAAAALGYNIEIYRDNLTESQALVIESQLISTLPNLVNSKRQPQKFIELSTYAEYFKVDPESPSGIYRLKGTWNGKFFKGCEGSTGTIANKTTNPRWVVSLHGVHIYAHTLVWLLTNGAIPEHYVIDHIDGNSLNNRIENLRVVPVAVNCKNNKKRSDNTIGVVGIVFAEDCYKVRVYCNHKVYARKFAINKYGLLPAFTLACEWRKQKIEELNAAGAGYTDRHGT